MAWSLFFLASVDIEQGEYTRGYSLAEESLVLFKELGDKGAIFVSLILLAKGHLNQGNTAKVHILLEEGLALCSDKGRKGTVLGGLGQVAFLQGNTTMARSLLEESLANLQGEDMDEQRRKAWTLSQLARVAAVQGDHVTARAFYEQSLAIAREVDKLNTPFYLEGLAGVVAAQGELPWAARLWGAAEALRDAMGTPLPPVYRTDYERSVATARTQVGEQTFAAVWAEGRTMTPEQAFAAQEPVLLPTPTPIAPPSPLSEASS